MSLIAIVVTLIIVGVLLYLVGLIPMDGTILTIIRVIVILLVVLWLLDALGIFHFSGVRLR
jgi:hypothetical protein